MTEVHATSTRSDSFPWHELPLWAELYMAPPP